MFKVPANDLIEEIKSELFCYEEITEEKILEWENKFKELLENNSSKTLKVTKKDDDLIVTLKDETEIFQLADSFWASIINNEEDKYWESLK